MERRKSQDSLSKTIGESLGSSKEYDSQVGHVEEEEQEEEIDPLKLLTEQQIRYFKEIFDSFDVGKKGRIPIKYIGYVLRLIGLNPTKAEIKKCIEESYAEQKNMVGLYFFLFLVAQKIQNEPETAEDIIEAFQSLDEDNQQYLTVDFLSEVLTSYGEDLEDSELELFLKVADPKNTGRIYYREFVEKMFGIVKKPQKKNKEKGEGKKKKKK